MYPPAREIKVRIQRLLKRWRPILGLDHWSIEVRYDETEDQGYCTASPQYEEATIGFNLVMVRANELTPLELEDLVVHELVHCIVWKNSERAVTQVTRALLRAKRGSGVAQDLGHAHPR